VDEKWLIINFLNVLGLMFFKNQVLGCGTSFSTTQCFLYNVVNNTWNPYPSGTTQYGFAQSFVFQNKFYFFHPTNPVIFDPEKILWSNWTKVPNYSQYSCTVLYKNTFIRFGGNVNGFYRAIYQYYFQNDSWVQLNTTNAPMDMVESTCGVLPNMNVMIMGSSNDKNFNNYVSVYNVTFNTWAFYGQKQNAVWNSYIFSLGQRTFTVFDKTVYEFDSKNISLTVHPVSFFKDRSNAYSSLYVPSGLLNGFPNGCKGT